MIQFDLRMSLPAEGRFASLIGDVAGHGARRAGCGDADAASFGSQVESAVRELLAAGSADGTISVTVRRVKGPLEVVVSSDRGARTMSLEV